MPLISFVKFRVVLLSLAMALNSGVMQISQSIAQEVASLPVYFICFPSLGTTVPEEQLTTLDSIVNDFNRMLGDRVIRIHAIDDTFGSSVESMEISFLRARSIFALLLQRGISPADLEVHAHGENPSFLLELTPDGETSLANLCATVRIDY